MKDFIRIVRYAKPKFAPINKFSDFQRGWIGGVVDGDGGIHFSQVGNTWEAWLYVTNTNERMLELLLDLIGQGFILLKKEATETTKACYEYRLKARNALSGLLSVLKLYDKDGQRKLLIEALQIIDGYWPDPSGTRIARIEAEIKQLNKRGP